jgi:hypothetical protein
MAITMGLFDWLKPPPPIDTATQALIERAVVTVDPLIKQVGGYERKLLPAVQHAINYCDDIAARIPGPFEISRAAFAADPMVHALFGSADHIEEMLARSQCVRDHLLELSLATGQCCALLGMRHREKSGFGVELTGEIVRMDVPQKTLYFSDHTLAEPSRDVAAARRRLSKLLYDGFLKGFAAHVDEVRTERDGLHRDQAIAHACVRSGNDAETHTRRLETLREQLRATSDALQPEQLLDTLVASLADPEPHLRLDPVSISVDHAGVITGMGGHDDVGKTLHFAELTTRDQRRWVVILASIERDEARRALERFDTARRYIVI